MAANRLKSLTSQVSGSAGLPHPFDPLSIAEIEAVVAIVRKEKGEVFFNAVSLKDPPKKQMLAWLADPVNTPRPVRIADIVALKTGSKVYDGLVDLAQGKVVQWTLLDGFQPLVSTAGEEFGRD
jgi:primary-amine oxidase